MSVRMTSKYPPVSTSQFAELESALGVAFPPSYRAFLSKYNVAIPERNQIDGEEIVASVAWFYGISEDRIEDLLETNDMYSRRLPTDVLAIAEAAGGNLICLDLGDDGKVYWWDHEEEATDEEEPGFGNMFLLAPSFSDFLEHLSPRKPLTAQTLMGTMPPDDDLANRSAGLEATPVGQTWHHVEDGETMELLPTDIHRIFQHSGGGVILRSSNKKP